MYKLLKRVVISGHPGTGTTTLVAELAKLYRLKNNQVIKVGDLFRQNSKEKTGSDITGYYQRDLSEDLSIDNMQKTLLSDPDPKVIFILESRLGGFFVSQMRAKNHQETTLPSTITILITTDETVRFKRVFERDLPDIQFDQYCNKVRQRQEEDLKQWQKAYPQMSTNPLEVLSALLYDIHIDNTNLDINQTANTLNAKLIELHAVEEV